MADTKVGTITHFFDRIGVAVVDVLATLKVGDKIKIKSPNGEFEQTVESMQVEHANVEEAAKGDQVGMKVAQDVREGDEVFLVG